MERTRSVWGTCCPCHDGQRRKDKNKNKKCEGKKQHKKFYCLARLEPLTDDRRGSRAKQTSGMTKVATDKMVEGAQAG